ncbi:hypothetical protein ACF0H5_015289 [Mactra antiquata]
MSHEMSSFHAVYIILVLWIYNVYGDSSEVHIHYDPAPVCNRLDLPGYPNYYMVMIDFYWETLKCPPGAVYEPSYCDCIFIPTVPPPRVVATPQTIATTTTARPVTTTTTTQPTTTTTKITTSSTTTTTTEKPWRPPVIRESGVLSLKESKKRCSGCKFEGGVGYKPHDEHCNLYIVCSPGSSANDVKANIRQCSVGEYWDQSWLTCRSSKHVQCHTDVCKRNGNFFTYGHSGDCRGYWKCEDGVSVGHCCPKGEGYMEGFGCVPSPSCNSLCGDESAAVQTVCDKSPVPGNPKKFRQSVPGHGQVEMNCAAGTIFDYPSCNCQTDVNYKKPAVRAKLGCQKDLDLSFTSHIEDNSGKHVHSRGVNLTFKDNSACFNGSSAIVISRFANAIIGTNIDVRLKFKFVDTVNNSLQAILYNGDCDMESSMLIAANKNKVEFKLRNTQNKVKSIDVHIPIKPNKWIDGRFSLHKNKMSMTVEGRSESRIFFGSIARSRCGLKLGWGKHYDSFVGCINKISLSLCPENTT